MSASPPIWLTTAWEGLVKRQAQHTLPHAWVWVGHKGVGKRELSQAFAQRLLCQTQTACGYCHACVLFSCGHHPDYRCLDPLDAGQIKIDQIRAATESLTKTAQQGGYRVVVIQDAHTLNVAAGNALLKTLEEPGDDTLLILLTDREAFLSATLRSRCQLLKITADEVAAYDWLQTQHLSAEAARACLALSENAPFLAIELAQSHYSEAREQIFKKIKQRVSGEISAVEAARDLVDKPLDNTLLLLQLAFMEIIRRKTAMVTDVVLQPLADRFTLGSLFASYDAIVAARRQIQGNFNLNVNLALENVFLTMGAHSPTYIE